MAIDFGGMGAVVIGWASSLLFWMLIILGIILAMFFALVLRKKRKFDRIVLEIYDLGNVKYTSNGKIDLEKSVGIFDFKITKGGWFGNKTTLFKLWDYGSESIFRLKDGTPVYDVSHNDYRRINGMNGLVVYRNPDDAKFAVPLSKFFINKNSKLALAEIAPVDLRNAATQAIDAVDSEMKTKWEQLAPILTAAFLGLILIFSILLITQYGKHMVDTAREILKEASQAVASRAGGSP